MKSRLDGKVALVTGGSSGIGRASALVFAKAGAKVTIADMDVERGEEAVAAIVREGGEAFFIETDVTRADDVANAVYLLCKDEAAWINGCVIPVDGGEHLS